MRGAAHVQPLLATLASRQPALRRAAADTLRHLAERWADMHRRLCGCRPVTGRLEDRGATSTPTCAVSRGLAAGGHNWFSAVEGTHAGSRAALLVEADAMDSRQQALRPCRLVPLLLPVVKFSLVPASAVGTLRQSTGRAWRGRSSQR